MLPVCVMTDHGGTVTVRAPGTSANLGPGFDAFGLCLGVADEVTATVTDGGLIVDVVGEGADEVPRDESHLVVRTMMATFRRLGEEPPAGLALSCTNRLPHGRGLGSSAAAIVSGVLLAEALSPGHGLSPVETLRLAAELEGHPDNVAACLLGGLTIAWTDAEGAHAVSLDVHEEVRPVVFVPPSPVSTELARRLLPDAVPHADAAANAGRAGLLVAALTSRPDLLLPATEDRIHQSYRAAAMPESLTLVDRLREAAVPAVVSGAGPSVLAMGTSASPVDVQRWSPPGWQALDVGVDVEGATTTLRAEVAAEG